MRALVYILSIFILLQVLMPCADAKPCDVDGTVTISQAHDHVLDADEHCSPFCVCSCCGISINMGPSSVELTATPIISEIILSTEGYTFQTADNIFQPPKFC